MIGVEFISEKQHKEINRSIEEAYNRGFEEGCRKTREHIRERMDHIIIC